MHGGSEYHQLRPEQEGGFYQVWLKGWILSGLANTHKGWILSGNRTELYIVRFHVSAPSFPSIEVRMNYKWYKQGKI